MTDMLNFIIDVIADTVTLMTSWKVVNGVSLLAIICAIIVVIIITRGLLK